MPYTFYRVSGLDQTEGKSTYVTIGYFTNLRDAHIASQGRGEMGCCDGKVETVTVYTSIEEWGCYQKQEIRQRALAKLSHEEKESLGLLQD